MSTYQFSVRTKGSMEHRRLWSVEDSWKCLLNSSCSLWNNLILCSALLLVVRGAWACGLALLSSAVPGVSPGFPPPPPHILLRLPWPHLQYPPHTHTHSWAASPCCVLSALHSPVSNVLQVRFTSPSGRDFYVFYSLPRSPAQSNVWPIGGTS